MSLEMKLRRRRRNRAMGVTSTKTNFENDDDENGNELSKKYGIDFGGMNGENANILVHVRLYVCCLCVR
jgi:hypothetical protein